MAYVGKTKDALTIENDKMADGDFRQFLVDAFKAANDNMKPGAAFYIWHADSEGFNFRGACKDIGWDVKECLIWNKNQMVLGRQDYQWKHEPCLYGWKPGAPHNWYSDRKQTTVIDMSKPNRSEDHPTMVACEKMGRKAMLMELDPKYCDVIIRRYIQESGNLDLKVERDGKIKSLKDVMEEVGATLE